MEEKSKPSVTKQRDLIGWIYFMYLTTGLLSYTKGLSTLKHSLSAGESILVFIGGVMYSFLWLPIQIVEKFL